MNQLKPAWNVANSYLLSYYLRVIARGFASGDIDFLSDNQQ